MDERVKLAGGGPRRVLRDRTETPHRSDAGTGFNPSKDPMLEEIHSVPEDRAKVQLMIDLSLIVFGLYSLSDGVIFPGGLMPLLVGAAAAPAGLASMDFLNRREELPFFPARVRA